MQPGSSHAFRKTGELARLMSDPRERLLDSRSARDLLALSAAHPQLTAALVMERPLLREASAGQTGLEQALDSERRTLIRANEERLARYRKAALKWSEDWPALEQQTRNVPLLEAHELVVRRALELLPFAP